MKPEFDLQDYDEFKAATSRLVELQLDLQSTETRKEAILKQIDDAPRKRADDFEANAIALVVGNTNFLPTVVADKLQTEYRSMLEEIRLQQRASELQKQIIDDLRSKLSVEICARAAPEHRKLVRDVAEAVKALSVACTEEQRFRYSLRDAGVLVSALRPMVFTGIGDMNDGYSRASIYLRECHEFGFLDTKELPEALLKWIPPKSEPKKS